MIFATPNAEKASRELKRTVGACAQNPIRAMALIALSRKLLDVAGAPRESAKMEKTARSTAYSGTQSALKVTILLVAFYAKLGAPQA